MSVTKMRDWLVDRVAYYTEREPAQVATDIPLVRYGMDSVYATSMTADIEGEFGLELDPTALWDRPTINALTEYLVDRLAEQKASRSPDSPLR